MGIRLFISPIGPAVVHCSAGIGRSGTFCIVDTALLQVNRQTNEMFHLIAMFDIEISRSLLVARGSMSKSWCWKCVATELV